jgi:allantoate deiminase
MFTDVPMEGGILDLRGLFQKEHGRHLSQQLQHHVHVVAFSDEEGARFHTTFLGSRAFAGACNKFLPGCGKQY